MKQAERSRLLHEIHTQITALNSKKKIIYLTTTTFNQVTLDCLNGWVFNVNDLNIMTYALDLSINRGRNEEMEAAYSANLQRNFTGGFLFTREECYFDISNVLHNGVRYESIAADSATRADIIARAQRWGGASSSNDLGTSRNW
jgi:hypothetical protein